MMDYDVSPRIWSPAADRLLSCKNPAPQWAAASSAGGDRRSACALTASSRRDEAAWGAASPSGARHRAGSAGIMAYHALSANDRGALVPLLSRSRTGARLRWCCAPSAAIHPCIVGERALDAGACWTSTPDAARGRRGVAALSAHRLRSSGCLVTPTWIPGGARVTTLSCSPWTAALISASRPWLPSRRVAHRPRR